MSEKKKCTVCRTDAKWEWRGKCYCEFCLRTALDVHGICTPSICEMCGASLHSVYYTDDEDNPFCSTKCALEHNGACEIEEERNDDE